MAQSLELEWLEDFIEVIERGSFTRAAERRGLNQSSLSRRIQSLELWLGGARLFDRQSSPLQLTPAGEEFREYATRILLDMRRGREAAARLQTSPMIPFCVLDTLAATFFPRMLKAIRENVQDRSFDIRTSLLTGDVSDCVEAVAYGASPFMLVYENAEHRILAPADTDPESIQSVTIARDRLIPVCGHASYETYMERLRGGAKIPFASYPEGSFLGRLVEEKCRELGLEERLKVVDTATMSDTLRNLAREDQGAAWVLHSTAENALNENEVRILDIDTQAASIELEIVLFRSRTFSSPSIDQFTLESVWKAAQGVASRLSPPPPPPHGT